MQLPANTYCHPHQGDRGRPRRAAPDHAAGDGPRGRRHRPARASAPSEPAFGLPALWIDRTAARGGDRSAAAPWSIRRRVLTTHLTEVVKENMAELLSYAETQKLLDELPREQQKLVADMIPSQISVGGVQRVLQTLLAERVSIRDLPTILEGIQRPAAHSRASCRHRRACARAAGAPDQRRRTPAEAATSRWSRCRRSGRQPSPRRSPARREDRQLAMAPSKLQEFMQRLRDRVRDAAPERRDAGAADQRPIRPYVRAIVERIRAETVVMSQNEIHPKADSRRWGRSRPCGSEPSPRPP